MLREIGKERWDELDGCPLTWSRVALVCGYWLRREAKGCAVFSPSNKPHLNPDLLNLRSIFDSTRERQKISLCVYLMMPFPKENMLVCTFDGLVIRCRFLVG